MRGDSIPRAERWRRYLGRVLDVMNYQHFGLICGRPEVVATQPLPGSLSLSDALEEVFPADTGLCVMQWNGIFIPLSYKYDVSWILPDAIDMVEQLTGSLGASRVRVEFPSNTFRAHWDLSRTGNEIRVDAVWHAVAGSLVDLLRARTPLTVSAERFISEWRHLFAVAMDALQRAGYGAAAVRDYDRLGGLAQVRSGWCMEA